MTFNPKIFDENSGLSPNLDEHLHSKVGEELVLSEVEETLALQLAREAQALAERYPTAHRPFAAPTGTVQLPLEEGDYCRLPDADGSRARDKSPGLWGPALALLVAVTGLAASVGMWAGSETVWPTRQNGAASFSRAKASRTDGTSLPTPNVSADVPALPAARPALAPSSRIHELSGPELEGFLDLLQQDAATVSRLSI